MLHWAQSLWISTQECFCIIDVWMSSLCTSILQSFSEVDVHRLYFLFSGCEIFAYDHTISAPSKRGQLINFFKIGLGKGENLKTLSALGRQ